MSGTKRRSRGSPRLQLRIDPVTLQGLRAYAVAESVTRSELVRRIIAAWAKSRVGCRTPAGGVLDTLSRIGGVIGKLQLHLYTVELAGELKQQGNAGAGKLDVPLNREELFRNAMNLLHEAVKLSENEELAAKAKARMQAMHLATQASFAAECILRDYQRDDIIAVVNEVVKTNECLKEELRKLRERAEEATPASQ
ncbi:MAG TPA: hypothetical protein VEI80_01210 [Candidatus Acidoferrales bacterium]|nr:hypothetical protein [Candidatus Acidoferrales bacterium]